MILVSACLVGVGCRYDGKSNRDEEVLEFLTERDKRFLPICPEQLGGLSMPRNPSIVPDGGLSSSGYLYFS